MFTTATTRRQGLWVVARRVAGHKNFTTFIPCATLSTLLQDSILIPTTQQRHSKKKQPPPLPLLCGGHIRLLSTSSSSDPNESKKDEGEEGFVARTLKQVLTPRNQFYLLVAGGSIGAYGISRIFLSITGFFTHLTPTVIAKWGFYTGFGCATLLGGMALVTVDNLYIRADPVYRYCFNWVQGDPFVQKQLGDGIVAGNLRSYRLDAGKVEFKGTRDWVWRPPRIQMIFDVTGTGPPYRTGLVTCEAVKAGGFPPRLTTTLLKVDYETGNEGQEGGTTEGDETYYLKGSAEDFARVSQRSGLSLEMLGRAMHIEKAAHHRV